MPNAMIHATVIGVGEHGENHARLLQGIEGTKLAGVYDLRAERAQQVAAKFETRAFRSLDEAFEASQAAVIAIPTTDHSSVARQALERGLDVLVEKPMATTVTEADEMIRAANHAGRILQVGHLERFNPGVVAAKSVTRDPMFFEIHRLGVFAPRSLDVDVVYDLMIHDLDLVLWFVESSVRDLRAVGLPVLTEKVDIANARLEFESGAVANLTASRVSTEKVRKFRYFQPHEYISIDFARRDALILSVERAVSPPRIGFRKPETPQQDPLQAELKAFVHSVRTREKPLVSGVEGRAALDVAAQVANCIEEYARRVQGVKAAVSDVPPIG